MFFPPVALTEMGLSGFTKVKQQLCWGTEGLFKLSFPVFISLKMRDYAQTYQSEGHCDG